MKHIINFFPILLIIIFLISCGSDSKSTNPTDIKSGAIGTWLVTRTLITYNPDFPNGYQDQQTWTIATSGDNATLTTSAGTINGTWATTQTYLQSHWVFEYTGPDPRTGFTIKIVVEIIGIAPFKATNETYVWDQYAARFILAEAFSCTGVRR